MLSIALLSIALLYNLSIRESYSRVIITLICLFSVAVFELSISAYPVLRSDGDEGQYFFWLASCLSLGSIVAIGLIKRTPLSQHIIYINLLAMSVHLYGLYVWWNGLDILLYTTLTTFTIVIEAMRLMLRTKTDGVYRSSTWLRSLNYDDSGSPKRGNT